MHRKIEISKSKKSRNFEKLHGMVLFRVLKNRKYKKWNLPNIIILVLVYRIIVKPNQPIPTPK